jgi:transcriptional regulator with XRE-family HTH domain
MSILSIVKLGIARKLQDRTYRRRFFKSQAQDDVAQQLRSLRERRKWRQADLAKQCKMKQSAISRVEQATYSRWSFPTLLRIADALDARVRVIIQPAEDALLEYERIERETASIATQYEAAIKHQTIQQFANSDANRNFQPAPQGTYKQGTNQDEPTEGLLL